MIPHFLTWLLLCPLAMAEEIKEPPAGSKATVNDGSDAKQAIVDPCVRKGELLKGDALLDCRIRELSFNAGTSSTWRGTAVPAVVTDTLSILAEIAYDRAKSQGYAALHEHFEAWVCDDLAFPEDLEVKFVPAEGTELTMTFNEGPVLPRTCEVVSSLNSFVELANAAESASSAIEADIISFTSSSAMQVVESSSSLEGWGKTQLEWTVEELTDALTRNLTERRRPDLNDARQLFAAAATHDWLTGATQPKQYAAGHGLKVSFALLSACAQEQNGCDALMLNTELEALILELEGKEGHVPDAALLKGVKLSDLRETPSKNEAKEADGKESRELTEYIETMRHIKPRLLALLADSQQLLAGTASNEAQTRLGISLAFDILDLVFEVEGLEFDNGNEVKSSVSKPSRVALSSEATLSHLRVITMAILDDDMVTAVARSTTLLTEVLEAWTASNMQTCLSVCSQQKPPRMDAESYCESGATQSVAKARVAVDRALPVAAALAANAGSLELAYASPESSEAAREARKQTLEALIDASTRRDNRGGSWVSSIGANVGLVPGRVYLGSEVTTDALWSDRESSAVYNPLTMPMGIAMQYLPKQDIALHRGGERDFGLGFHSQLSLVDLAMFLPSDTEDPKAELQWADFLIAGGQVGLAMNKPHRMFIAGLDARYAPYAPVSWQFGLFASYYVPFFDLN